MSKVTPPTQAIQTTIQKWHQIIDNAQPKRIGELLADAVVFHSPVLHTPQSGKTRVSIYLTAAFQVLIPNQFTYVREIINGHHAMLEFEAVIDGINVNGVDIIEVDDTGQIIDFKVMLRPLKALTTVQQKMFEVLQQYQTH